MTGHEILPDDVKPTHYKINIVPGLDTGKFFGHVSISLTVNKATKVVVANSRDLEVHSASITAINVVNQSAIQGWQTDEVTGRKSQKAVSIILDEKKQTVHFNFEHEIPEGATVVLHTEFRGIHNDQMVGFYRSGYKNEKGEKKWMVVTQFESVDCRRCFPSWDEPALKATFEVTLNVPKHLTALSNMNVLEESEIVLANQTLKKIKFATTPIMSTYLVAMVVGELDYVEKMALPTSPADAKPILCRTYTLKGQSHLGQFALDTCVQTLEFFSEYFDISYPLPKMDMIAIPDFAAGAMENWGLVTYREEAVLYDSESSSLESKEEIAYTVGHELAHQWFGNLVTMQWWNALWLNEGFATFVGWLAVDKLHPEWCVFTNFLVRDYTYGITLDGQRSSHPVEVDVSSGSEIDQIFDSISYCKGGSVIRMLEGYLGRDVFAAGVTIYLKKHAFGNATTEDLWTALSAASGQDVGAIMREWILQTGIPELKIVGESYDAENRTMNLQLEQKRFLATGDVKEEDDTTVWNVPVLIRTTAGIKMQMLSGKSGVVSFPFNGYDSDFYKLNANGTGFYRVNNNVQQLENLASALVKHFESFSTEDRITIISDVFAFALAGQVQSTGALELLYGFKMENEFIVLEEIVNRITVMKRVFGKNDLVIEGLNSLILYLFAHKLNDLGYDYNENEPHSVHMLRTLVITALADANDKNVVETLINQFELYEAGDLKSLHPEIRGAAFSALLRNSQEPAKDFTRIFDILKHGKTLEERNTALKAIGATKDMDLVHKILNEIAFTEEIVKPQDVPTLIASVARNLRGDGTKIVFEWFFNNWPKLHARFHGSMGMLRNLTTICMRGAIGQSYYEFARNWSLGADCESEEAVNERIKQLETIKRPLDQALESVSSNTAWYERDSEEISKWLNNKF